MLKCRVYGFFPDYFEDCAREIYFRQKPQKGIFVPPMIYFLSGPYSI